MKKILSSIAILTIFLTACKSEKKVEQVVVETPPVVETVKPVLLEGATHTADVVASTLTWKGFKPGGFHNGSLSIKEGAVIADSTGIKQGSFVIDMTTLKVLDIPADSEDNAKLTGHLSSPDFFDTTNNPTATFIFKEVETKGKNTSLKGDLTLKGISKPISVPVTISEADGITTLKAAPFKIDRTEYGIQFKSKKFFNDLKDKFINDEIEIGFEVKLKK
jgi:polyisoprenoid-binding protein YceI